MRHPWPRAAESLGPFVLHTYRLQLYTRVVSVAAVILKIILTMLVTVEEDAPLR